MVTTRPARATVAAALALAAAGAHPLDARPGAGRPGDAHPLHTSLTAITYDAPSRTARLSVRVFADDFLAAAAAVPVARAAGGVTDEAARTYVASALTLAERGGPPLPLAWCGARRVGDFLWLCLTAPAPRGLAGAHVQSRILFERFSDQVNIVQADLGGRRQSMLFTRGDGERTLD
ncbi:MAG: DUF6702 family protein [Gemmatimonadaceae bacterium]